MGREHKAACKAALLEWCGVVGVGERGDSFVVYVERDTIAIPDQYNGYRLVKEVSGKVVAGMPVDAAMVRANAIELALRAWRERHTRPDDCHVCAALWDLSVALDVNP